MIRLFLVGFFLGVLYSCTPSSSSPNEASAKLVSIDYRDMFAGDWCWDNTVACGVSKSNSKTSLSIKKSAVTNEVVLLGLNGVVAGSAITISPKADSFGGIWSGKIERNGSTLMINLSIYYSTTGVTCTNTGTAILNGDCVK